MKPIKHIYIGLLLILASTVLHAKSEAIDGIYHVDINNKYPNLVKDSRDSDDSPVLPNFEPKNSKVLEIEKAFFFFLFSQTLLYVIFVSTTSYSKLVIAIYSSNEKHNETYLICKYYNVVLRESTHFRAREQYKWYF